MAKVYALTARAEMGGTIQEPGFRFTLNDGELGPHKTVVANANAGEGNEPLYIEVEELAVIEQKHEDDSKS